MKYSFLVASLLLCLLGTGRTASIVSQVAAAGDYDTVSSTLFTPDPVLLTGTTSNRIALFEFPLNTLAAGQQLDSAKLNFRINGYGGGSDARFIQFAILGYAGDGVVSAADATSPATLLGTGRFDYNGTSGSTSFSGDSLLSSTTTPLTLTLDVTSFVSNLIGQSSSFLGLQLKPIDGTAPNSPAIFFFGNTGSAGTQTTITVNTSVPEPATWFLSMVGIVLLFLISHGSVRAGARLGNTEICNKIEIN